MSILFAIVLGLVQVLYANGIVRYCKTLQIHEYSDLSSIKGGVLSSCFQFEHCSKKFRLFEISLVEALTLVVARVRWPAGHTGKIVTVAVSDALQCRLWD